MADKDSTPVAASVSAAADPHRPVADMAVSTDLPRHISGEMGDVHLRGEPVCSQTDDSLGSARGKETTKTSQSALDRDTNRLTCEPTPSTLGEFGAQRETQSCHHDPKGGLAVQDNACGETQVTSSPEQHPVAKVEVLPVKEALADPTTANNSTEDLATFYVEGHGDSEDTQDTSTRGNKPTSLPNASESCRNAMSSGDRKSKSEDISADPHGVTKRTEKTTVFTKIWEQLEKRSQKNQCRDYNDHQDAPSNSEETSRVTRGLAPTGGTECTSVPTKEKGGEMNQPKLPSVSTGGPQDLQQPSQLGEHENDLDGADSERPSSAGVSKLRQIFEKHLPHPGKDFLMPLSPSSRKSRTTENVNEEPKPEPLWKQKQKARLAAAADVQTRVARAVDQPEKEDACSTMVKLSEDTEEHISAVCGPGVGALKEQFEKPRPPADKLTPSVVDHEVTAGCANIAKTKALLATIDIASRYGREYRPAKAHGTDGDHGDPGECDLPLWGDHEDCVSTKLPGTALHEAASEHEGQDWVHTSEHVEVSHHACSKIEALANAVGAAALNIGKAPPPNLIRRARHAPEVDAVQHVASSSAAQVSQEGESHAVEDQQREGALTVSGDPPEIEHDGVGRIGQEDLNVAPGTSPSETVLGVTHQTAEEEPSLPVPHAATEEQTDAGRVSRQESPLQDREASGAIETHQVAEGVETREETVPLEDEEQYEEALRLAPDDEEQQGELLIPVSGGAGGEVQSGEHHHELLSDDAMADSCKREEGYHGFAVDHDNHDVHSQVTDAAIEENEDLLAAEE
ncbi:hypothetical protein TGP89_215380 [Toxoplasma gondii p89]|uniref:Uncharacterized protein n=1 Tax=Toxoplasma gondii p89 TaxID=943119 RepID=A0A086KAD8_TOXGO|nr:hypothetical protein TGP89_215380 [Toxoplasma gondii p89]